MPPKDILSEERVENSSDENSSDSNGEVPLKSIVDGHAQLDISKSHTLSHSERHDSESDADTSESDTGSSTRSKRRATSPLKQISQPLPKRKKPNPQTVKRIEASQYAPPRGYAPVSLNTSGSANSRATFSNMEGKQVWHISAPATVSISQIHSINLQAALRGGTILEQEGTKYTMKANDLENATILVADNVDAAYLPTNLKLSRSFHIEEKAKALDTSTEQSNGIPESNLMAVDSVDAISHTFFATHSGQKKTPRKQPENLKARYIPFGVSADRPNTTGLQKTRKHTEAMSQNTHQDHIPNSHDNDSTMSGVEQDSELEEVRLTSNTRHVPQSSLPASTPSKSPEKAKKKGTHGAMTQGSQPQTPSSTTKSHKEKTKHKRDRIDDMDTIVETPVSSGKTALQSPLSANVSSTPVSGGKKKRKEH